MFKIKLDFFFTKTTKQKMVFLQLIFHLFEK